MSLFRRLKDVKISNDNCNYTALAFSAMRRTVPPGMAELLRDNGDYEDLLQDARAAACEALARGLNANEAYNLAQRRIYAGMKACGYLRERVSSGRAGRWERRTSGSDALDKLDWNHLK